MHLKRERAAKSCLTHSGGVHGNCNNTTTHSIRENMISKKKIGYLPCDISKCGSDEGRVRMT